VFSETGQREQSWVSERHGDSCPKVLRLTALVCLDASGRLPVKALVVASDGDAVVVRVVPVLVGKAVVAGPDLERSDRSGSDAVRRGSLRGTHLHADVVARVGTGVEAEVGAGKTNSAGSAVDKLRRDRPV
jgi:hypothetical protein